MQGKNSTKTGGTPPGSCTSARSTTELDTAPENGSQSAWHGTAGEDSRSFSICRFAIVLRENTTEKWFSICRIIRTNPPLNIASSSIESDSFIHRWLCLQSREALAPSLFYFPLIWWKYATLSIAQGKPAQEHRLKGRFLPLF